MLQALHGHPGNTILPVLYWPCAGACKNKTWIMQGHLKVGVLWFLIYVQVNTFASVPKIFYIWPPDNDTTSFQNAINLSFIYHLCWCIFRWVSFPKFTSVWRCLFRLTEKNPNIWIFILYLWTLHKYLSNCSKIAHVNKVTTQPLSYFCYYTYNLVM